MYNYSYKFKYNSMYPNFIIVCVTKDILLKTRIIFTNSSDIIFNFLY